MAACGSRLRLTVILQMGVFCMAVLWASAAAGGQSRKLSALVEEASVVLTYHDGPLLSASGVIPLHLIWYGQFTPVQRSIVGNFVQSLGAKTSEGKANQPSASTWWKTTHKYEGTHSNNKAAPSTSTSSVVMLGKQKVDQQYSLGKSLKRTDIAALVEAALKSGALPPRKSPGNANAVYLVLTSEDVTVEGFCMSSCGFHANLNLNVLSSTGSRMMQGKEEKHEQLIPYAWVGNSASQCPGQCAWPFHQPMYGPQTPPLVAPNGDVGIDGMIINIAAVLAGAATNPFNTGYFQGDAAAPLEAVSACSGIYGKGAYPGFPAELMDGHICCRLCGIRLPNLAILWYNHFCNPNPTGAGRRRWCIHYACGCVPTCISILLFFSKDIITHSFNLFHIKFPHTY